MTEKHTPTLQDITANPDWWSADAGKHCRELALAKRYDSRADRIGRRPVNIGGQTWRPAGGLLGMVRLTDLGISRRY
jgi:hypothetical protein